MKSLLLIDVSSVFWAAWHAGADKELSFAYDATISKVGQLRNGYDHVAICCDFPPYWRKELLPTYKAQRDAPPPNAIEQFRRTKDRLRKDGLVVWECRGFEADDVIATAVQLAPREWSVTIASTDKDLAQLVDDAEHVRMVSTMTGKEMNDAAVFEKFGVRPEQIADFLSLTGDKSDNVPGVTGVGPVNAAKLLHEFGSLEDVLEAATHFNAEHPMKPSKVQANLAAEADAARLARKLVALRTDAPIKFEELFEERKQEPLANEDNYDDFDNAREAEDDVPISPPKQADKPLSEPKAAEPKKTNGNGNGAPLEGELEPARPTTAIQTVDWSLGLEPQNTRMAGELSIRLFNSRLYSKFPNQEAILAVIIRGREMGLGALTALDCFHVVEGKPCLHAHLIVAKVKAHPDCEYFQFVGGNAEYAEYTTKHRQNPKPTNLRYTIAQAKAAGLCFQPRDGKQPGNWIKRPEEMLRKTCAVQLARIEYPEAAMGLYSMEEMGVD